MSSNDLHKFLTTEVYDLASRVGSLASIRRIDRTQISNILSVYEGESNPVDACKMTITFIARQISRNEFNREVGLRIISDLSNLIKKFKNDELRIAVRKYLYLLKWFYESNPRIECKDFNDFIKIITEKR